MSRLHRFRLAVVSIATLIGGVAGFGVETPASASVIPPHVRFEHWVGEFEPGSDLEHYAEWVLDSVGVPAAEQAERYPAGGCGMMHAFDMVGLYLTQEELAAANGLIGQAPLTAGGAAFEVSLIDPVEVSGPWVTMGSVGRDERPTGIDRIGTPDWDDVRVPSMGGVTVGIVDTGVDARHEDLNVIDGRNCSGDDRGPDGWGYDPHGHGTHLGGTIGAEHNDTFVDSIAPGVPLIDATVFGASGSATSMTVMMGLNTAVELGADVINLSLGGMHPASRCGGPDVYTNAFCKAVHTHDRIVVVAAGNDTLDSIMFGPANVADVVTVGAIVDFDGRPGSESIGYPGCGFSHRDDFLAVFSNFGTGVDVVAPGGCILSTLPSQMWGYSSGTSMATPHVVGVIANFLARYPGCTGQDAAKAVLAYARSFDQDWSGWPGVDPPPLIRYVVPDPPDGYREPDANPCEIGDE